MIAHIQFHGSIVQVLAISEGGPGINTQFQGFPVLFQYANVGYTANVHFFIVWFVDAISYCQAL